MKMWQMFVSNGNSKCQISVKRNRTTGKKNNKTVGPIIVYKWNNSYEEGWIHFLIHIQFCTQQKVRIRLNIEKVHLFLVIKLHFPFSVENFTCDYCSETFSSKSDRIIHTSVHFTNKSCSSCGQILIRINDEWYGMHDSQHCGQEYPSAPMEDAPVLSMFKEEVEAEEGLNNSIEIDDNCKVGLENDSEYFSESSPIYLLPDEDPNPDTYSVYENNDRCETKQTQKRTLAMDSKLKKGIFVAEKVPNSMNNIQLAYDDEITNKKRDPPTKFMDHRPKTSLTCDLCKKVLANFNTLKAHMFNMHIPWKRKRVACGECGLTLASAGNLKAHMRIHWESKGTFIGSYGICWPLIINFISI